MTTESNFGEDGEMTTKQDEKRERLALAGSTSTTTYHALGNVDTSLGGRFAVAGDVIGAAQPSVQYPRLPPGNWTEDPTGVEPPLNYRIDDLEPTGEAHEIDVAASLDRLGSGESEAASDPAPSPPPVSLAGEGGVMGLTDAPSAELNEARPLKRDLLKRRKMKR
jgi:hypothetical protein